MKKVISLFIIGVMLLGSIPVLAQDFATDKAPATDVISATEGDDNDGPTRSQVVHRRVADNIRDTAKEHKADRDVKRQEFVDKRNELRDEHKAACKDSESSDSCKRAVGVGLELMDKALERIDSALDRIEERAAAHSPDAEGYDAFIERLTDLQNTVDDLQARLDALDSETATREEVLNLAKAIKEVVSEFKDHKFSESFKHAAVTGLFHRLEGISGALSNKGGDTSELNRLIETARSQIEDGNTDCARDTLKQAHGLVQELWNELKGDNPDLAPEIVSVVAAAEPGTLELSA